MNGPRVSVLSNPTTGGIQLSHAECLKYVRSSDVFAVPDICLDSRVPIKSYLIVHFISLDHNLHMS